MGPNVCYRAVMNDEFLTMVHVTIQGEGRLTLLAGDADYLVNGILDGYPERVAEFSPGIGVYANEDAAMIGLSKNALMSHWLRTRGDMLGASLLGSVLLIGETHQGDWRSLTEEERATIAKILDIELQ